MQMTVAPTNEQAGRVPRKRDGVGLTEVVPRLPARGSAAQHVTDEGAWSGSSRPLAGADLLGRLRVTGRSRAAADPGFTAELLAYLEDGLRGLATGPATGDHDRTLVTKDRLSRVSACTLHRTSEAPGERTFSVPLACGALVGALFRQIVTCRAIGDPMSDALESLSMDERQVPLVAWIEGLALAERSELRSEVERQSSGLVERWPALDGTWLPRTDEIARVPLVGGRVELVGRVDLTIGRPGRGEASVALVEVVTGARRADHRDERRFDALVETLRSGTAPFAVATYYARSGELDVEAVDRALLVGAARRCLTGSRALLGVVVPAPVAPTCSACSGLLRPHMVVVDAGRDAPSTPLVALTEELAA
jgi:hypothetical protein